MDPFLIGGIVVGLILLVVVFRSVWRVAEANEALIISGLGASGGDNGTGLDSLGFKIVVGAGTLVLPGFQTVRRLPLDIRSTGLNISAVSSQSIPLNVKGVVAYKIGDDLVSIANAARRFLDQEQAVVERTIHELFAGHLRAIVGGMTVEEMLHDRETLTANIRLSLQGDLAKLGLVVDSLQVQEIDDVEHGYIRNLGKPQAAAIEAAARIAAAERDQEATAREQEANAKKAESIRESEIKKAGYQAEIDQAKSKADQSGPLAMAQARQEVVRAETATAELDAQRTERMLESTIKKPADAEAYRQIKLAEAAKEAAIANAQAHAEQTTLLGNAEATATEANGKARATAVRELGLAEAAGIQARSDALASNPEAVVMQQIAENYPEIVRAAAESLGAVSNMVVLNGGEGVQDLLSKTMTMGGAGFGIAKSLISSLQEGSLEKVFIPAQPDASELAPADEETQGLPTEAPQR